MNLKTELVFLACASVVALPLAIQYWIEPHIYRRNVKKAWKELEAAGLTPERYMATINPNDAFAVAAAKARFGLE